MFSQSINCNIMDIWKHKNKNNTAESYVYDQINIRYIFTYILWNVDSYIIMSPLMCKITVGMTWPLHTVFFEGPFKF